MILISWELFSIWKWSLQVPFLISLTTTKWIYLFLHAATIRTQALLAAAAFVLHHLNSELICNIKTNIVIQFQVCLLLEEKKMLLSQKILCRESPFMERSASQLMYVDCLKMFSVLSDYYYFNNFIRHHSPWRYILFVIKCVVTSITMKGLA